MLPFLFLLLFLPCYASAFDYRITVENPTAFYGTPITVAIEFQGDVELFAFVHAVQELYTQGDIICEKAVCTTGNSLSLTFTASIPGKYPFTPPPIQAQTAAGKMAWHFISPLWLEWQPLPLTAIPLAPLFGLGGENLIDLTVENRLRLVEAPEVIAREAARSTQAVEMRAKIISKLVAAVLLLSAMAFVLWLLTDTGLFKLPRHSIPEATLLGAAFKKLPIGKTAPSAETLSQLLALLRRSLGVLMRKNTQGCTTRELYSLVKANAAFAPEEKELFIELFAQGEKTLFAQEAIPSTVWDKLYPRLKEWTERYNTLLIP